MTRTRNPKTSIRVVACALSSILALLWVCTLLLAFAVFSAGYLPVAIVVGILGTIMVGCLVANLVRANWSDSSGGNLNACTE